MYKHLTYLALGILICLSACTKNNTPGVSDNDPKEYRLYDYYEDQYGNKGIVGYIHNEKDEDGYLKFTIVISLDETIAKWGPMGTTVYQVNENFNEDYPHGTLFGLDVNRLVWNSGSERFPAFDWCFQKNGGETALHSSSWILPTYAELGWIFNDGKALQELNKHINKYGGTVIDSSTAIENCYWSCVEDIKDVFRFADDQIQNECDYDSDRRAIPMTVDGLFYTDKLSWNKNSDYHVRAIKYIYYERQDLED